MLRIEKYIFFTYIFLTWISRLLCLMKLTGMKTAMYVAETHWEGRVSPNFDIDLSFSFMIFRRVNF